MKRSDLHRVGIACLGILSLTAAAPADWQPVAPGIDYDEFLLPDPNQVYVARMDRTAANCFIESTIGQGKLISGRETVSGMAQRYDDALAYWGQAWGSRNDVVVAVNGDFFDLTSGVPTGGQIHSGWYAKRFGNLGGGSGFAWQLDRDVFIGECVTHTASKQKVTYVATGNSQNFQGINRTRGTNELIVYTPQYNVTTATDATGAEVLVEMARPTLVLPTPAYARGTVREIRPSLGGTVIPFDHVVLSAHGTAATTLLNNVSEGAEVRISQEITHYEHDCSTPLGFDWTKTYASIGGSFHFLKGGVIQPSSDPGATARHPRTAVAYNSDYVFFIVVDGRSAASVGMSMTELGTFCLAYLAATDGINQDGGGSSAMWINGQIMNVPSDGTERAVANGLIMAQVQTTELSDRLAAGDSVHTVMSASLRVGPGTNYPSFSASGAGASGLLPAHAIQGVLAKGEYWWKCQFGANTGWVPDTLIFRGGSVGDGDADGDVDLDDYPPFAHCLAGPGAAPNPVLSGLTARDCLDAFDTDADSDVDVRDFAGLQPAWGGD